MKKILTLFLALFILTACSDKYEDTNGENNYDLQTLKLEDVFKAHSCSSSSTSKSQGFLKNGEIIHYKNYNGIGDVFEFEHFTIGESSCTIIVSYHIDKGNSALVIRDDYDKIIHIFEINKDDQELHVEVNGDDFFYLTAYGESADFTVDYEIIYD